MGSMDKHFTTDQAEEGIQLALVDPVGRKTEDWLRIRGADSEEFRLAEAASRRKALEISDIEDEKERDLATMKMVRNLVATLVMGWSFDEECTHANVVEFFRKAPQVQKAVDRASNSRALFMKVDSETSSRTDAQNSDSTESQPEASKP